MVGVWIGVSALVLAAVVYFIFLPHIDGPSLDQQRADRREILICCPNCQQWQAAEPISSTANDYEKEFEPTETNWFRCRNCEHRWSEEQFKL